MTRNLDFNDRGDVVGAIERVVGLRSWHVAFVEELCTAIGLWLGEKRPRQRPLLRASESESARYEPEMKLTIWCPWRVRFADEIVFSAEGSEPETVRSEAGRLMESRMVSVKIGSVGWDLSLRFETGLILETFSSLDQATNPWMRSDISLVFDGRRLALGPGATFRISDFP
ncbi:MAG: hypothetical protein AB7O59_03865 [Pirellulales bacterium]